MNNEDILNIWKSHDQRLNEVLTLNKTIIYEITRNKLNDNIGSLRWPKSMMLILGIPYTLLLCFITWLAFKAEAYAVMLGFGAISIIMIGVVIGYVYHLVLIDRINRSDEIVEVQAKVALLKISSFYITKLAILQLPFWSICWMSLDAFIQSPYLYGGVHMLLFFAFSYVAYRLYRHVSLEHSDSFINQLFFKGSEWEPIIRAEQILEQLKEYET